VGNDLTADRDATAALIVERGGIIDYGLTRRLLHGH
jgi:hypothetical protein